MSRSGAPSRRLAKLPGIVICPRVVDLLERGEDPLLFGGAVSECTVCRQDVSIAGVTEPLLERGWAPVCSHDAHRFKHVLARRVILTGELEARRKRREHFAREHGVPAAFVSETLPSELHWMYQRGLA